MNINARNVDDKRLSRTKQYRINNSIVGNATLSGFHRLGLFLVISSLYYAHHEQTFVRKKIQYVASERDLERLEKFKPILVLSISFLWSTFQIEFKVPWDL